MRGERAGDLAGSGAQPRQLAPAQRRVHARHRQRDDALQRIAPPRAAAAELRVEHGEQGHQRRHLQGHKDRVCARSPACTTACPCPWGAVVQVRTARSSV